jgi:hypothetical protein
MQGGVCTAVLPTAEHAWTCAHNQDGICEQTK